MKVQTAKAFIFFSIVSADQNFTRTYVCTSCSKGSRTKVIDNDVIAMLKDSMNDNLVLFVTIKVKASKNWFSKSIIMVAVTIISCALIHPFAFPNNHVSDSTMIMALFQQIIYKNGHVMENYGFILICTNTTYTITLLLAMINKTKL